MLKSFVIYFPFHTFGFAYFWEYYIVIKQHNTKQTLAGKGIVTSKNGGQKCLSVEMGKKDLLTWCRPRGLSRARDKAEEPIKSAQIRPGGAEV